ncbi:TonB-dependent hemoglobin/transferrin/lactoferrin family receptor [Nitrospirillum sp. BR 11164]|uniref:TonB-dependent hemoglobin/transferrin/lactoferrin family receptor n=1 Tax=Nitrospirillum sp. BR 11164 TaxID=3104324 RepID=UPI002AFF63E7|nr:TonB-dependent hemoglobin/transferrin/lactoferrin family receptor [Nitrospirillum sp. BR 11164]MEA1651648.1 TonB-dependent hemoglobin/transferrin/lactoferrin family receptor [Nitrospirillum sp. BR 11164]
MRRTLLKATAPLWLLAALGGAPLAHAAPAEVVPGAAPADGADGDPAATVTVTVTRTAKDVSDVPASVSVITSQQIDDQLVTDIKDLVRYEPGVSVRKSPARFTLAGGSTGRDGDSGFNIRGLEGNRVLMLTDGIRVPDAYSFGAQNMGRGDYVDLGLLKSVEILRGPASALYGSDGVAGAVSFITKDPDDFLTSGKDWAAQGSVGYTSADGAWSKGALAAGRLGKLQALVAYTRRDGNETATDGSNNAANTDRTTANPQDLQSNAVLAKVVFEPSDAHRLRLTFDHDDNHTNTTVLSAIAKPPLASTSVLGLIARDRQDRNRVSLDHRYDIGADIVDSLHWTAYYQETHATQYGAEDRNTAADRTRDSTFDTNVYGIDIQAQSKTLGHDLTHTFVYGGDYSVTHQESLRAGTVPSAGDAFPSRAYPTTDYTLAGIFLQDEISAFDGRLTLYPAVRFDYYDLSPKKDDPLFTALAPISKDDSHVSPKLGVLYHLLPDVGVFVNLAEGFKAPAPSQVNNGFANPTQNYKSVSNPNLKAETSQTIEGGFKFNGSWGGWGEKAGGNSGENAVLGGGRWDASLTGYAGRYRDFIDQVQVGGNFTAANPAVYQYVNLSRVSLQGAEAKGQVTLNSGIGALAAFSYTHGDSTSGGVTTPLDSVDPWKLVLGVTYRDPAGRFGGQVTMTHSGAKDRSDVSSATYFIPKAFTILDATAYWAVTENASIRAGVFNLTDEKYWWWGDVRGQASTSNVLDAWTQPGRNFGASLTLKL